MIADTQVKLEGGQNFRDLGGYASEDGRVVRHGLIFRSGSMSRLTSADVATLTGIGLRTVIDLRSTRERAREPVTWPAGTPPEVLEEQYILDASLLLAPLAQGAVTAAAASAATAAFCADLPFRFAHRYRELFAALLAGRVPLVVGCSAGKDRTGVAAALILSALGVRRRDVIEDYLLSNRHFDPTKTLATDEAADPRWRRLPDELARALLSVHAGAIEAAFEAITRRSGSLAKYLADEMGVGEKDVQALRDTYLV